MTCDVILFGLQNGQVKYISEVERGKACNCVCPSCDAPLLAKKGKEKIHHFAHASGTACEGAGESALHYAAKRVICEASHITLPALRAHVRSRDEYSGSIIIKSETIFKSKPVRIKSVEEEVTLDDMRPDIIVTLGKNNRELFIEIAVTHFIDPEKLQKIKRRDIPAVEINLSRLNRHATLEEIRAAVLSGKHIEWVFSSVRDKRQAELQQAYENKQKKIQEAREEQERREWKDLTKTIHEYERINHLDDCESRQQTEQSFFAANLPDAYELDALGAREHEPGVLINHPVSGEQFLQCPRSIWQARILLCFRKLPHFSTHNLIRHLRDTGCINDSIWKIHRWKDDYHMRSHVDDLDLDLVSVVEDYLEFLYRKGIVTYTNTSGNWNAREWCMSAKHYTPESSDELRFIWRFFSGDIERQGAIASRYFYALRKKLLELSQRFDPLPVFQTRLSDLSRRLYQTRLTDPHETRLCGLIVRLNKEFERQFHTREVVDSALRRGSSTVVSQLPLVKQKLEQRLREFDGVILEPDTATRKGAQCIKCGHKFWTSTNPSKSRCPECFCARIAPCQMVLPYKRKSVTLSPLVVLPKRRYR